MVLGFSKVAGHKPVGGLAEFRPGAANLFAKWCFLLLRGAVQRGQVVLAAETKGMQGELQRFSGLPASLYPHPVELGAQGGSSEKLKSGKAEKLKGEVRVIAPGFARHEKGSDLLQEAIKLLGAKAAGAKFVLQWQEDFPLPDGSMVRPDSGLQADGVVEYLSAILTGEDYLEFLRSGDLVVLPYRSGSYNRRVSRVSVEAALIGKPIIYTRDTWSAEVAEMAGGGVEIPEETPAAIAAAIEQGLADLTHLQQRAERGTKAVRDYYSVAQFRELLVQEKRNTN